MTLTPGFGGETRIFFESAGEITPVQDTNSSADKGNRAFGLFQKKFLGIFQPQTSSPRAEIGAIGLEVSI